MTAVVPPRARPLHALQRRLRAEELVRRRQSDDVRRSAAPHRAARIDPNPHQVEAVIFALRRLREGGCILADEVGLGKTIESGLVIAQLLAEGARRVLLIAPKSLLGQWRQELAQLFGLPTREGSHAPGAFEGDGVFLVNREAAGSVKGRDALLASAPFDLCVIDEAHEVFAGLYKRYDADGLYDDTSPHARTAGRVREVLQAGHTPVLLLTATPIQNNLAELWGLIQFVDPLGTLVGDLPTFREVFCGADDRQLAPGQDVELRARLKQVLQRTLRRQAQAFLEKPFVDRQARLFEYAMSAAEKTLYDDVTRYLLEPGILAFQGNHRQLLLLGFHRRMASSTPALAASLERVAARLRAMLEGRIDDEADAYEVTVDLDDTEVVVDDDAPTMAAPAWATPGALAAELTRVEGFVARAKALAGDDGKFRALLQALGFVTARAKAGQGAGKLVIFTESLVTQEHLARRLVDSGFVSQDEVTVFRGANDSPRARAALERWRAELKPATEPSPDVAIRLALVHEFQTRSRVFISTEAGAKGLNLQFCDTLVNYDLPWNPQRIEQRIGRCHRYGQRHDVTVINFLAKDNEAQALTFDILSRKLELFGTVLSASDQVLHRAAASGGEVLVSALGAEFEGELKRIWERARTIDEVTAELRALRDRVDDERKRFEQTHARTAALIEESLDGDLQRVFTGHRDALPVALAQFDADVAEVVTAFLDRHAVPWSQQRTDDGLLLTVEPSTVAGPGRVVAIGASRHQPSLHLGHPLVVAAVEDARRVALPRAVGVRAPGVPAGKGGRLQCLKVGVDGFEQLERLVVVAVFDDGTLADDGAALLAGTVHDSPPRALTVSDEVMLDAREERLFTLQAALDETELARAERVSWQAERFVEDRLLVLRRRRSSTLQRLEAAANRRDSATGSEQRTEAEAALRAAQEVLDGLEARVARLEARDDETFRRHQHLLQQRRDTPPRVEVLFDVEFITE